MIERKIVSNDSYSLFFERDIEKDKFDCTAFKNNYHMDQNEIAESLNFTQSAISIIIKRALRKVFRQIKRKNRTLNPIEIISIIAQILNVKTDVQYKRFFRNLPKEIQNEVVNYAVKNGYVV